MNEQDRDILEGLIDKYDLNSVLQGLFNICHLKAEHLRSNWQDKKAAKEWEKKAKEIDKITYWE
jgi:hypothetical protein